MFGSKDNNELPRIWRGKVTLQFEAFSGISLEGQGTVRNKLQSEQSVCGLLRERRTTGE